MTAVVETKARAKAIAPADEDGTSIRALLKFAIEKNVSVEALEKLVALHERVEDRAAAKEFADALAAFQSECPPINKTSTAKVMTKGGGSYSYTYAELDEIARTVNPLLSKRGLSYGWDSTVANGSLTCVCTVRHVNGHKVTASMTLPIDNPSAMNDQQKVGAALTFAQRRSLTSALGVTTADPDSDAADLTPISDEQADTLAALMEEVGANPARFLEYCGVHGLKEIPAINYGAAVKALEAKRKK